MRWLTALCCCWITLSVQGQEASLDAVRQEVREPRKDSAPTPDHAASNRDNSSSCSSSLDDPEVNAFFGKLGLYIVASPFTIPVGALGDTYEFPASFVAYPYAEGWPGFMQIGIAPNKIDDVVPNTWEHLWNVRASVELGTDFNDINRLGIVFLADSMTRVGIGGGMHVFEEKQACGCVDQLVIGDLNLLYRFAQSDKTQFRAGLGTRFLSDQHQTDWGFNAVYGFDYFPKQPWSIGMQLETGTLGNAWVFRATGRIGLVWKFSEVYAGYDYLRIGNVELQGPMIGLRIWF